MGLLDQMRRHGVRTFVIGFGSATAGDFNATVMNSFADAGGIPNASIPGQGYYTAKDPASLHAVMDTIGRQILGCSFTLSQVPPDLSQLYIFFDGARISTDGTNGWTYSSTRNTLDFFGASCQQLSAGTVRLLQILYGCPSGPG